MEVAKGHVTDRPFARTFYMVATRRFTGDLVLTEGGRPYKVSWEDGRVVAAESSSPSDSPGRVALAAGLVTSTHVARSLEIMASSPQQDPVDVLAGLARLGPDQVTRLKRRLLGHRAGRLFALPAASFVLDNARSLRADPDVPPLDARWLVYFGLRTHYSAERLEAELAGVAERPLTLAGDARRVLSAFGFGEPERAVLARLEQRAYTLRQLVDAVPEADTRLVRAVFYALVACDCLEQGELVASPPQVARGTVRPGAAPAGAGAPPSDAASRLAQGTMRQIAYPPGPAAPTAPGRTRPTTITARGGQPTVPPAPSTSTPTTPPAARPHAATTPPALRRARATLEPTSRRGGPTGEPPDGSAARETQALIDRKLAELDAGADHFTMLGITRDAPGEKVRSAYFALAKRLHPDRLRAVGVSDATPDAQRLFARINLAFAVLSDARKRAEYVRVLSAGGEAAVKKSQANAEEMAMRALRAEETFRLGEMALRRGQFEQARTMFEEASSLNPDEAEYQALLAWSTWLSAPDKVVVAAAVQRLLAQAIATSPRCVPAHFYLGQVAKQSGRRDTAIQSFRQVLELAPDHAEASLELRVLLGREKRDDSKRGSLLDRLKKR